MKRSWDSSEDTPSPSHSKMSSKGDNGHSRVESSSRSQTSSYRSRTPRRKKSLSPLSKRAKLLRQERHLSQSSRSSRSERTMSKRSRASTRSRSRSRHTSKDKGPSSYSSSSVRDLVPARVASREHRRERYHSGEKYAVGRPPYRGPDKDLRYGMSSLKKIIVNMKGTSQGSDTIKREIVNPEGITLVRRAGEGSRPIFDRDEIKNSKRKYEEDEHYARRYLSDSPPHSGRRPCSVERFRSRDPYYEDERRARNRDPSGSRPREYGPLSHDRYRDERSRYMRRSRSRERSREFIHERRERYEDGDYRRNRTRPFRRHPSPMEMRRINGRRLRSPERGELPPRPRDKEVPPNGEYPPPEYPAEGHYYEGDAVEGPMPPSSRGGGHPLPFRGRGTGMPMVRGGEVLIRGGPPVRPVRALFFPRVPGMGRRLPFPPRLIRPIVRPIIRVIAPVIPVRSPPVIPVRHPVIPLPFQ